MDNIDFKMRHLANTVARKGADGETKETLDRAEAWVRLVWDADEDLLEKMKNIMKRVQLDNLGECYTCEQRLSRYIVIRNLYDKQGDIIRQQDVALFKDSFFAERHVNILNVWGDRMDTFGYIVESSGGQYIVKQIVRSPFDGVEDIIHARFKDIESAEEYAIEKNTDLMFDAYEAENSTQIH